MAVTQNLGWSLLVLFITFIISYYFLLFLIISYYFLLFLIISYYFLLFLIISYYLWHVSLIRF